MQSTSISYRPHNPGHDYFDKGIYLITLVVSGRENRMSSLNMDARQPNVVLTDMGTYVCNQWKKTEELQVKYGNKVRILNQVAMPDHWHGVIQVVERMSWSLGDIIQSFKSACTSQWRRKIGYQVPPLMAHRIRHMSHERRRAFYQSLPLEQRPFFDDDYDDTICMNERHKQAMLHYVDDNPRRAIMRRLFPNYTQRLLHIRLTSTDKQGQPITRDYAAFGNLFLLRWARKVQVFCHRKLPGTQIPYESTDDYKLEHDQWVKSIIQGATVIVTPGISKGELLMKNECIEKSFPIIHIQKEPIGQYWKPEQSRFDACVRGSLLILAPWAPEQLGEVNHTPSSSDYSIFHNLNDIAAEICRFEGDAVIVRK